MVLFGFFKKKPDSLIGEILDKRYEITKRLGEGGFGDTYLAIDIRSKIQQPRVVKHLHPKDVPSNQSAYLLPKLREMFEREKTVLETLGEEHPYKQIPRMIDHFDQWNEFFYVQEFVDGKTLDDRGDGEMSRRAEVDVRQLLIEILEVLAFVHQRRVVHRDLKPANIMRRSKDRRIVLIDFGAVKDLSRISVNRNNQRNSSLIIGTPAYMPPEQQNGEPQLASDVYAIGMIGIQALTGYVPLTFVNRQTLAFDWVGVADVSQEFADILNRMISYRPIDRYPSAVDALQAIQNIKSSPAQFNPPRPPKVTIDDPFAQPAKPISIYEPTVVARPNKPDINQKTERIEAERRKQKQLEQQREQEKVKRQFKDEMQRRGLFVDLGNGVTLELVKVPAGKFMMGMPASERKIVLENAKKYDWTGAEEYLDWSTPQHEVRVPSFLMGKYAVTNAQWESVMVTKLSESSNVKFQDQNQPVIDVSWDDSKEFCKRLSEKINKNVRLPSEAEWEYACRAGTTTAFHFGETITPALVNYDGNYPYGNASKGEYRKQKVDVQSFSPNAWGLYQMHGNAWEWCEDIWHENYNGAPTDGSAWLTGGEKKLRALRGGSWHDDAICCRSASRFWNGVGVWSAMFGFRVVVDRVPFFSFSRW